MFLTFLSTALLALLCSPAFGSAFNVSTPVFTQCAPVQLSWDSTYGPFNVLIANQSDPCGYAVADLGDCNTNSVTWIVAIPKGWYVLISVEDGSGDDAWSQPILVQARQYQLLTTGARLPRRTPRTNDNQLRWHQRQRQRKCRSRNQQRQW